MFSCVAKFSSVHNEPVVETPPLFLGHNLHKVTLNVDGVSKIRKIKADSESTNVCIHGNTRVHMKHI
jgi:hypothetical protein